MGQLGVLTALTINQVNSILAVSNQKLRRDLFLTFDEELVDNNLLSFCTNKSWYGIDLMLTDCKTSKKPEFQPLNNVIFGTINLYTKDCYYTLDLKTPDQVKLIYQCLLTITEDQFYKTYRQMQAKWLTRLSLTLEYIDKEYIDFCWETLKLMYPFWQNASETERFVIFYCDH